LKTDALLFWVTLFSGAFVGLSVYVSVFASPSPPPNGAIWLVVFMLVSITVAFVILIFGVTTLKSLNKPAEEEAPKDDA
jgi:hypothetical protein